MAKKKKPSAGPGAARFRATVAQGRGINNALNALKQVATSHGDFTLKDEARNTGQHSSLWGRATNLRMMPVSFVSAGVIEPLKEIPKEVEDDPSSKASPEAVSDVAMSDDKAPSTTPDGQVDGQVDINPAELDRPLDQSATFPEPSLNRTSPTPESVESTNATSHNSGGSEPIATDGQPDADIGFVIDVTGDKSLSAKIDLCARPKIPEPQSSAEDSDSSAEVILFKGRANLAQTRKEAKERQVAHVATVEQIHHTIRVTQAEVVMDVGADSNQPLPSRPRSRSPEAPQDTEGPDLSKLLASEGEEDAIIADYIANMVSDSGDDDYLPKPLLRDDLGGPDPHLMQNPWAVDASSDDDSGVSGDEGDVQDSRENENASPTMDDETLAKLLAKQEELGMGSDELILLGGHESTSYLSNDRKSPTRAHLETQILKKRAKFTSASAVADAFDDLDLMDWERPSLQNPRKGGRRGKAPDFDVSDSELETALETAWTKDREAKKSRKLRREELRSLGLLGKNVNPDDPRLKYPTGMTLDDIKAEFRDFLLGSEPILQLPPMDKHSRKILHDLANRFKIKSQSTGSGDQRRPTLHRTKYTVKYVEENFEFATARIERKHFPRLDSKGKGKGRLPVRPRGGAGSAAVTYLEGEVVGASAPELGQENKGRTMLEKMGWSIGMGLGSTENKGILQPVAHVVKRTKAGLG